MEQLRNVATQSRNRKNYIRISCIEYLYLLTITSVIFVKHISYDMRDCNDKLFCSKELVEKLASIAQQDVY